MINWWQLLAQDLYFHLIISWVVSWVSGVLHSNNPSVLLWCGKCHCDHRFITKQEVFDHNNVTARRSRGGGARVHHPQVTSVSDGERMSVSVSAALCTLTHNTTHSNITQQHSTTIEHDITQQCNKEMSRPLQLWASVNTTQVHLLHKHV